MGTNNKSELTAGLSARAANIYHKTRSDAFKAPFSTSCYLSVMSTTKKLMTSTSEADRVGY